MADDSVQEVLEEMREEFLAHAARLLRQIETLAAASEDQAGALAGVVRTAHTLKGAGGTFGFAEISEAAAQVERLARLVQVEPGCVGDLDGAIGALGACVGRLRAC
jgi:HPt (histidine-containing phosphotransfer) domain-containing protein